METLTDVVHVPVPVNRLQEVYELLAKRPVGPQVGHVTEEGYPPGWSQALVERMYVESSSTMRGILRVLAEGASEWITTGELASVSGLTSRQVAAALGPFGKRIRGRYGMTAWPFSAREFVDQGIMKYSMSPVVAARILELATEVEAG